MISTPVTSSSITEARTWLRLLSFAILFCAGSSTAQASSPCTVGLPSGAAATLDGKATSTSEWSDAGLLQSNDPCLALLADRVGGADISRTVKVFSKRYTSTVSGLPVIAFLFEVPDASRLGPSACGGELCLGERIVLQFDANRSRGPQLAGSSTANSQANDYQIIFTHKWGTTGTDVITNLTVAVFERQSTPPDCTNPEWVPANGETFNSNGMKAQRVISSGTGYSLEIEVPLSFLGNPTTDIGFAFAILNDIGTEGTCSGIVCDGFGIGFPNASTLPVTNATNPITPCFGNWVVPDEWGTGVFGLAAGSVSVSRSPDYWSNNGLLIYKCSNTTTPNYQYFNNPPCQATLKANVVNATGSTQTRNLLFLWSPVGAGTPANYNFIELVEHVSLPVGTTPVFTSLWNRVPHNQMAHPCVRVYVLPDAFVASFPRSRVVALTRTAADVAQMESAYNLSLGQWTQKNITQITSRPDCDLGCDSTGANDMRELRRDAGRLEVAMATRVEPSWPEGDAQRAIDDQRLPGSLSLTGPNVSGSNGNMVPPQKPPVVSRPGNDVRMTQEELDIFSRSNVIVQVRAVGFANTASTVTPRYNFLENLGGVITLVPIEILQQRGSVSFQFNVTNDNLVHTIFLVVDMLKPSGVSQAQIALDTGRKVYAPNENRVFTGVVSLPGVGPVPGFKHWGLSLHAGVSIPHGDFSNFLNPGANVAVDLEYRFNKMFSVEGIYGFHHFTGDTIGPFSFSDLNVHQVSINGKVYGTTSPVRPFFNFGGGVYNFGSGPSVHGGLNLGGGVQFDVKSNFAVEGVYNLHNVFTSGSNTTFSAVQGGVRFRF